MFTAIARRPGKRLDRPDSGLCAGGTLDIGAGDRAAGAARGNFGQLDPEPLGQSANRRRRPDRRGLRHRLRDRGRGSDGKLTDDRAAIGPGALLELHQRRADLEPVARLDAQPGDLAVLRRRHLDHRLLGFDRDERLVGDDMVALADMPSDQLRLLQPLAEIRQNEDAHDTPLSPPSPSRKRGPRVTAEHRGAWIPAFAGMTKVKITLTDTLGSAARPRVCEPLPADSAARA